MKIRLSEYEEGVADGREESEEIIRQQQAEIGVLKEALQAVITISDRKHDAWDKAKELLK